MASVLLSCSNGPGAGITTGATSYSLIDGILESSAENAEANAQVISRVAGTYSNMRVRISANAATASGSIVFRKGGASGNQSITVGSGVTGELEDTSNTDSVVDGDLVNYRIIGGTGGTTTYELAQISFEASSGTAYKVISGSSGGVGFSTASVTRYVVVGSTIVADTVEADVQHEYNHAATFSKLYCYVSANSRTTTTTVRLRINGGNGNQSLSIGSSTTGAFEDTSNTDSTSAGNKINFSVTTGTGTGTLAMEAMSADYSTSNNTYTMAGKFDATLSAAEGTRYLHMIGNGSDETEANTQINARFSQTLDNLWAYVSANTYNVLATIRLRINGGFGNNIIQLTASTTGEFQDTTNSDSISDGDLICLQFEEFAASGTFTLQNYSMRSTVGAAVGGVKDIIMMGMIPFTR